MITIRSGGFKNTVSWYSFLYAHCTVQSIFSCKMDTPCHWSIPFNDKDPSFNNVVSWIYITGGWISASASTSRSQYSSILKLNVVQYGSPIKEYFAEMISWHIWNNKMELLKPNHSIFFIICVISPGMSKICSRIRSRFIFITVYKKNMKMLWFVMFVRYTWWWWWCWF